MAGSRHLKADAAVGLSLRLGRIQEENIWISEEFVCYEMKKQR